MISKSSSAESAAGGRSVGDFSEITAGNQSKHSFMSTLCDAA
ncbi:MAG: hypothetical protein ACK5GD_14550 [Planctomycetota bacterium]